MAAIEYDPNRSARIALLHYRDGEKRILAPHGLKVDDTVVSGRAADILPGNALRSARPGRHDDPQHRAPARQGWPALPERRHRAQLVAKEGDGARQAPVRRDRLIRQTCMAIGQVATSTTRT